MIRGLRQLRIGIHNLGDTDGEVPPVHALTSRGIVSNLVGYNIFGSNLDETNPASDLIKAVANGDVDLALAWGPIAGYFARSLRRAAGCFADRGRFSRIPPCRSASTLPLAFASGRQAQTATRW